MTRTTYHRKLTGALHSVTRDATYATVEVDLYDVLHAYGVEHAPLADAVRLLLAPPAGQPLDTTLGQAQQMLERAREQLHMRDQAFTGSEYVEVHEAPVPAPAVTTDAPAPWYPPVPEGFGPWIEVPDGMMTRPPGLADDTPVCRLTKWERENKVLGGSHTPRGAAWWAWDVATIVAYCVKLPA